MTDQLTGLSTHLDLRERALAGASVGLLVDVDGLIWTNDRLGFVGGDRVLVAVANALCEIVSRHGGQVFRVGGDEFLIMLDSLDRGEVISMANRVVTTIDELSLPYGRADRPERTHVEVNVVAFHATAQRLGTGLSAHGLTSELREWFANLIYQEKRHSGRDAGVVVDAQNTA